MINNQLSKMLQYLSRIKMLSPYTLSSLDMFQVSNSFINFDRPVIRCIRLSDVSVAHIV